MKVRKRTLMFMDGLKLKHFFCFEVFERKKWRLAGSENDKAMFETVQQRDEEMQRFVNLSSNPKVRDATNE